MICWKNYILILNNNKMILIIKTIRKRKIIIVIIIVKIAAIIITIIFTIIIDTRIMIRRKRNRITQALNYEIAKIMILEEVHHFICKSRGYML